MKVFISYSTYLDQIIALRLQTLASVYGMTIYVPPATTRQETSGLLIPEVQNQLRESEVLLAVITHVPVPSAVNEMNFAVASQKLLIPIVSQGVPPEYYVHFHPHFLVDPQDPSRAEHEIVRFLAGKQQAETTKNALLALATLTVGLLLFGSDSK